MLSHIVNYLAYFLLPPLPPNSIIKTVIYLYLKHHHSHLGLFSLPLATRLDFPFVLSPNAHDTGNQMKLLASLYRREKGQPKVCSSLPTWCAQWEIRQTHFSLHFRIIVACAMEMAHENSVRDTCISLEFASPSERHRRQSSCT